MSFLLIVNYKIIIQFFRVPIMTAFTAYAVCPYVFAAIVSSFACYYSIFNLVDIPSNIVINDLKITASAFGAFLVCHGFSRLVQMNRLA